MNFDHRLGTGPGNPDRLTYPVAIQPFQGLRQTMTFSADGMNLQSQIFQPLELFPDCGTAQIQFSSESLPGVKPAIGQVAQKKFVGRLQHVKDLRDQGA